ncbi:hypothetical protein HY213_03510, partial [Candidatus Peregrinibacteria bacterium]|nr:hypothetical protein [Candidatus Peregrinibacteria bacterium]
MTVSAATNAHEWDAFLIGQRFRPFLQSWTMGEVYREIGQEPVRLEVRENGRIVGICFGHVVPAKRGKHLAIPYGPICEGRIAKGELDIDSQLATRNSQFFPWIDSLKEIAKAHRCS